MIKRISLILSMIFIWVSVAVVAQQQQKPKVDYRSDITNVINQGEIIKLTGNVAFHHNGAIITCDTAYMYEDQDFEGIGNVIINSDSTYIYGDRFTYDEKNNIARVYAPIIKTIDKEAVLYTHNMEFNTYTNIASYYGGGTITQDDNLMESERGDYHTQTRELILTGNVEMKNDDYLIKTDSVGFDLNTDYVTFFTKTSIWNDSDEYLEAYSGSYDRRKELYTFTDNAYMLSAEQEVWADSIRHWSKLSESELRRNIQIVDTTQNVMFFGNYGHYWANLKKVIMTDNASALSYNPDIASDSTFIRADTLLLYPMLSREKKEVKASKSTLDSLGTERHFDNLAFADTLPEHNIDDFIESKDSMLIANNMLRDSMHNDFVQQDSLIVQDSVSAQDSVFVEESVVPKTKKELKRAAKEAKQKAKEEKRQERLKNKPQRGWFLPVEEHDHEHCDHDHEGVDTLSNSADSIVLERPDIEREPIKSEPDSSDYFIKGIDSVLVYKLDIQAVCDTIISISFDSTLHLNNNAIVWNMQNQITAEEMVLFSKGSVADRAELYGFPIIAQEVAPNKYNQVRGKFIEVYFENNEIDVTFVDGNAQTVFYQEEEETPVSIFNATSSSMVITFDSSEMSRIKWVNDVVYDIFPLDKTTAATLTTLEGFKWEIAKRPRTREEVCNAVIKESRREFTERIERPKFGLTEQIENEKIKYTEQGIWSDRSEDVLFKVSDIVLMYD
ncbi:MAG: OstA-like protein [Rikenellaceae bacterium]